MIFTRKDIEAWQVRPLDSKGEPIPASTIDPAYQYYECTAIGLNLDDSKQGSTFIEVTTGQGQEADVEFATVLLDALRKKTEFETMLERAESFAKKHEKQQHWNYCGTLADRVPEILARYESMAESHIAGAKHFRDDMIVYMRALVLVAEMVGNAGTHGEKNARLRGLIEQLETTVQTLRDQEFDFSRSYWRAPDVFRSDFPVRRYQERVRDLESQVKELERNLAGPEAESKETCDFDDSDPFADESSSRKKGARR